MVHVMLFWSITVLKKEQQYTNNIHFSTQTYQPTSEPNYTDGSLGRL